jgi:integrase
MRPQGGGKLFSELIHQRVEALAKELEAGEIKPTYFEDCKKRGNYLLGRIDDCELNDINAEVIKNFFDGIKNLSYRSKLNYWRQLNSILSLAEDQGHLHQNPLSSFTKQDKKDCVGRDVKKNDDLCILTVSETRDLLEDALQHPDYNLLPQFVVRLFCGLRTLEAAQLTWDDIKLDDDKPHVKVTGRIAKNRSRRNSDIPPNAVKWLSLFDRSFPFSLSADKGDTAQKHYDNLWKRFCIATGRWQVKEGSTGRKTYHSVMKGKNLLRHSFASYYYELTGDSMKTAEQMGHRRGDSVLFDTYYSLTNKGDGQKFFNITPNASESKVIQMPRAG